MPFLTCYSCNIEFDNENSKKIHYKSEWHRYNLKRKIAGVPGITEALFLARQSAIAEQKRKMNEQPMLYTCGLCGKGYRSSNAHAQHLKSRAHTSFASQADNQNEIIAIIKPLSTRRFAQYEDYDSDGSDEWEKVDQNVDLSDLDHIEINGSSSDVDEDEYEDELDPTCCFMCDQEHETIESCMIHMHKKHGFFVPDIEYLKDPAGFLNYLGLKVKRDYMCLYCSSNCKPFNSLEAVRKHMVAKGHCRVHYGDDDDEAEAELDEFYDYSSSYVDENGKQLITADVSGDIIELGVGGSEIVITRLTDDGISTKAIGSREYLRYYRQKPRPSSDSIVVTPVLTVQSKERMMRMKVIK